MGDGEMGDGPTPKSTATQNAAITLEITYFQHNSTSFQTCFCHFEFPV